MHIFPVFTLQEVGEYKEEGKEQQYICSDALALELNRVC
jgi:hypothetical protein